MNHKFATAIEAHPALGYLASLGSMLLGWLAWFVEHASDFAQFFGLVAGLFGMIAGYYTMRIQRRAWKRRHPDDTIRQG